MEEFEKWAHQRYLDACKQMKLYEWTPWSFMANYTQSIWAEVCNKLTDIKAGINDS